MSLAKARRKPAKPVKQATKRRTARSGFGTLPEWDLADLYASMEAPELARDLERADADSRAFEQAYKGKLATLAADGRLTEAVRRYEALDDLLGRLISYAGLVHA